MSNTYYSRRFLKFVPNIRYILNERVAEDTSLVPRFTIKNEEIFADFPVNKKLAYNQDLIIRAIKFGMILLVNYSGDKDKWKGGRERTIYPMVLGKGKDGQPLLRGFHLKGWSVSKGKVVEKEWRLFRTDRIKSITFTGSFFRLPPEGYKRDDSIMKTGTIAYADFPIIRRNQEKLVASLKIQTTEDAEMTSLRTVQTVEVSDVKAVIDLTTPWNSGYVDQPAASNIRLSFLKSTFGNKYIAVLGALGKVGNRVKLYDKGKLLGTFVVLDAFMADQLPKKNIIGGKQVFDLFVYKGKKGA